MIVELVDANGIVLETIETHNVEVSDDRGFSVNYLREANDEIPDATAEIRVHVTT